MKGWIDVWVIGSLIKDRWRMSRGSTKDGWTGDKYMD